MKIRVAPRGTSLWKHASAVVSEKYQDIYGALVAPDPGHFVVAIDDTAHVLACAGITFAAPTKLFSEQYLDAPIEKIVADRWQCRYQRDEIAEIGSLVSNDKSASLSVIRLVPLLSWCMGAKVLLCSITPKVADLLKVCSIQFDPICQADPERLGVSRSMWGSYYDSEPVTGLIHVANHRALFADLTTSLDFMRSRSLSASLETAS